MKIVDSNIIIYAAREFPILRVHLNRQDVYISEISKLEVLGYPNLKILTGYFLKLFLLAQLLLILIARLWMKP